MVAKERAQLQATRQRIYDESHASGWFGKFYHSIRRVGSVEWDSIRDLISGYGHKPTNAIIVLIGLIAITSSMAFATWRAGDFAPNSSPILISREWQDFAEAVSNPALAWSENATAGKDYETFNAIFYGADVVIPLVSFGQEAAWGPSTSRSWIGKFMHRLEWVMTLVGWIVTAIGAAAVTGVIRRD
jgi:hypothetical protein